MIQPAPQADQVKERLRDALQRETLTTSTIQIAKHQNVYICGDQDEALYLILSGQIKLLTLSPAGKECVLAIYTQGDIFGESCLSAGGVRPETARAMEETVLKRIPSSRLSLCLSRDSLLGGLVQYLAERIADQQQVIAHLLTVDSEHRLAAVLLRLARQLGRPDPHSTRIAHRISHEELAEMVGTTRPRISRFMQRFRELGLIEVTAEHHLIIKEERLAHYLDRDRLDIRPAQPATNIPELVHY